MWRKASVDKVVLDAEIIKRKNVIVCKDDHSIPGTKDKVWKNIADIVNSKCHKNISSASVRLRIALNRDGIQNRLGLIPLKKNINSELKICDEDTFISDSDESLSDMTNSSKKKCFTITFSVEDWKIIQPHALGYMEKSGSRTYELLTPHVWTDIIQDHFFLHTRLPCAISFKKNRTSSSGKWFLSVNGKCKECGSNFIGFVEEIPAHTRAIMRCTYSGHFHVVHTKKRRLAGLEKKRALDHMIDRKESPSVYRTNEARRIMKTGDVVPAQIPTVGALRQAKSRALSLKRLHSDPINALYKMKLENRSIRDIGYDKCFVHFWSDLQLKIYKECCLKNKTPTISFDATGGCCRKLKRNNEHLSGPIFLYEGVMNVNNQNFTVLSMLSEQHDNVSISLWMKRWIRCNVPAPKVIISDQSLALMSAIVQSFTQYQTLEKYLNVCFSLLEINDGEKPICFIRNDVNHFVHLITTWQPLKISKYPRTKQLFTRAMCLLIFCKSLDEAKRILEAIFTIALSKYDGPSIYCDGELHTETACARSKRFLQSLISNNTDELIQNLTSHDIEVETIEEIENEHDNLDIIFSFKDWAKQIALTCEIQVDNVVGEYDNAQYVPELVPIIINTMKLFPCWSSIMVNVFGYGEEIASSCRIESHFNNLKNRILKNEELPIRIDSLVEKMTEYYAGDHLLLEALTNVNGSRAAPLSVVNEQSSLNILPIVNEGDCSENIITEDNSNRTTQPQRDIDLFYDDITSEKSNESSTEVFDYVQCKECDNGDIPTGVYCCADCNKSVHFFGCCVNLANTEEGYGGKRVCLACHEIGKDIVKEVTAVEKWKKKGSAQNNSTKRLRSATSYLNKQSGFDKIDLNKKGKITIIALLRNGSCFKNKPLSYLPGLDKVLLNNTCSADSVLSILAICADESNSYYNFFLDKKTQNNRTATFVLNMINNKPSKDMYRARVHLLSLLCTLNTRLIGDITYIDTMDTALSMTEKLLDTMPSYIRTHRCSNTSCFEPEITNEGIVISFNAFNGKIDIQTKLTEYFQSTSRLCVSINCGHTRDEVIMPMEHIIVELIAIPPDYQNSIYGDTQTISEVQQNYAGKVLWKLGEINKNIIINDDHYNLKGIIAFNGSEWNLRQSHGHYIAYCLRAINDQWECYDDTKDTVTIKSNDYKVNVELLFYTKLL